MSDILLKNMTLAATKKTLRPISVLLAIIFLVAIDQVSKHFLVSYLKTQPGYLLEVSPFFDIVYSWNYGISFGLFSSYSEYSNYFFVALNSGIIIGLGYVLFTNLAQFYIRWPLTLIVGGAIGNVLDRLLLGAVFDFISIHYQYTYFFPAFNLADSFISVGAAIYIWGFIRGQQS